MDPKPENESGNHPNEIIQLHVVVKNLQSIQTQTRFEDFMVEVDDADFDILLLTETWRSEREELWWPKFISEWLVHLLVMLVLAFVFPKHCPVTCWMLHSMHIRKGFAPYTCHLDTGSSRFLHVTFLLHGLRMLMLKVYMNCWICSSRIAGNPELFQS